LLKVVITHYTHGKKLLHVLTSTNLLTLHKIVSTLVLFKPKPLQWCRDSRPNCLRRRSLGLNW